MELKDLVRIGFEPLENHAMLISDFSEVYEYKDNKKQKKFVGIKLNSSLQMEKQKGLLFLMLSPVARCGIDAEICH